MQYFLLKQEVNNEGVISEFLCIISNFDEKYYL